MINYAVAGNKNLFMLFWEMFHPKLYVLPFIAILNSRLDLQNGFRSRGASAETVGRVPRPDKLHELTNLWYSCRTEPLR